MEWEVVGGEKIGARVAHRACLSLSLSLSLLGNYWRGERIPPLAAAAVVGAREVGVGGWRRSWRRTRSEAGTEMGKKE